MSAREKLDALIQQEKEAKELAETAQQETKEARTARLEEEERVEKARIQLYEETKPAAEREQIRLFRELGEVGLVPALEELTDRHHFAPKMSFPNVYGYLVKPATDAEADERRKREWQVKVAEPDKNPDGSAISGALNITASFDHWTISGRRPEIDFTNLVKIDYQSSRQLVIAGEAVTFKGVVTLDSVLDHNNPTPDQTDEIETALAMAFHKPLREDHGWLGDLQKKEKQAIAALADKYGARLGRAIGKFLFDVDREDNPWRSMALARAVVSMAQGSQEDQIRALGGIIEALTALTDQQIVPLERRPGILSVVQ